MPTPITHALVGSSLAQLTPDSTPRWKVAVLLGFLAALPDLDMALHYLGVPYPSTFGHRGLSHSIFFAACIGFIVGCGALVHGRGKFGRALAFALVTAVAVASHGVLDAATNGGAGIGLFIPFNDDRFFFTLRPIIVSPFSPTTFLERAYRILRSEVIWVWCPLLCLSAMCQMIRFARRELVCEES